MHLQHSSAKGVVARILLLITVLLQACGSTATAVAIPYQIELVADDNVNPDLKDRPSPIVVEIFELRADAAFEASSFFSLQDKPEQSLGRELISVERMIIRPGEKKQISRPGDLDAHGIGIIAEYRDLESNRWRKVIPLSPPKHLNLFKFWQTSSNQLKVRIAVKSGGIELLPTAR